MWMGRCGEFVCFIFNSKREIQEGEERFSEFIRISFLALLCYLALGLGFHSFHVWYLGSLTC